MKKKTLQKCLCINLRELSPAEKNTTYNIRHFCVSAYVYYSVGSDNVDFLTQSAVTKALTQTFEQ